LRNVHFALRLGYDGSSFCGWQLQPPHPSVAGALASAAEVLFKAPPKVTGASRTDSGVHAREQFVKISGETRLDAGRLMAALNSRLPSSVRVYSCREVSGIWRPKSGVFGKRYVYRVWTGSGVPPHLEARCWPRSASQALDALAMQRAAQHLVGEHDFQSFRSAHCQAAHARRLIWHIGVRQVDDHPELPPHPSAGSLVEIDIRGNAFCQHQVRIMAGTLVDVGRGQKSVEELASILKARDRRLAGMTAPAKGLTLWRMYQTGDEVEALLPSGHTWPGAPWEKSP
jgi:tRNA pseudouridine38-40 synthase